MSRMDNYREIIDEKITQLRRLRYMVRHEVFNIVYATASREDREIADVYIEEQDADGLKNWFDRQRFIVWEGWTLTEIRQLASDERVRNARNKSRERLITEIGYGPLEAKEKARRQDSGRA